MFDEIIYDLRALIWLVTTAVLGIGTYLVWPSRWNIPAHVNLAFYVVASLIPAGLLGALDTDSQSLIVAVLKVMLLGTFVYTVGLLLGASAVVRERARAYWRPLAIQSTPSTLENRAMSAFVVAIVLLTGAIAVMGFVPMFAPDPFMAKFFRGPYADAYTPVAPLYRAGTAVLSLLIPIAAVYAARKGKVGWKLALAVALGLMIVTLQRGPAFSGILLFLGVILISRGRVFAFVAIAIGSYVAGTLFYFLLGLVGVRSFEGTLLTGGSLLKTIAATAPDIPDAMNFYSRWLSYGAPLTNGRTIVGGLVPGNYPWNPSVWSLTLGDESIDVRAISSGGLRLPMPIWGMINFGPVGVVIISLVAGLIVGYLARRAHLGMIDATENTQRMWIVVVFGAQYSLFGEFYVMSYMDVVQIAIVYWILAANRRAAKSSGSLLVGEPASSVLKSSKGIGGLGVAERLHRGSGH